MRIFCLIVVCFLSIAMLAAQEKKEQITSTEPKSILEEIADLKKEIADLKQLLQSRTFVPSQFFGHDGSIFYLAYSPDGKFLASGCSDGTIRIWDVNTGKTLAILTHGVGTHRWSPGSLQFSPDGKFLAFIDAESMIRIYDMALGKIITEKKWDGATKMRYTPDGKSLAICLRGYTLHICDVSTFQITKTFKLPVSPVPGFPDGVTDAAVSPDGKFIAISHTTNASLFIYEIESQREIWRVQSHPSPWVQIAYSPDGKYIASVEVFYEGTNYLRLWNAENGQKIAEYYASSKSAGNINPQFSPDSKFVMCANQGHALVYEIKSGRQVADLPAYMGLTCSPDGKFLAMPGTNSIIYIWPAYWAMSDENRK